jgi:hypothetical protein
MARQKAGASAPASIGIESIGTHIMGYKNWAAICGNTHLPEQYPHPIEGQITDCYSVF